MYFSIGIEDFFQKSSESLTPGNVPKKKTKKVDFYPKFLNLDIDRIRIHLCHVEFLLDTDMCGKCDYRDLQSKEYPFQPYQHKEDLNTFYR